MPIAVRNRGNKLFLQKKPDFSGDLGGLDPEP
jgi:hypothetical protein